MTVKTLEERFNALLAFLEEIYGPNIIDDHEPPTVKPAEGFIKEGGWGANQDPDTWTIAKMKDFPNLYKVVDDVGKNVATDFTSIKTAQSYIDWAQSTDNDDTNIPETPPPVEPPSEGKSITKDGIEVPFEIEQWDYTVREDWRDGGARFNMKCPASSVVIVGAFTGKGGDDEVSPKLLMGRHTGTAGEPISYLGCGYDGGMPVAGGTPRLRFEGPHNKYSDAAKSFKVRESVDSCHGKFKLYMAAAVQEETGVRFSMYQGKGDNESKPSNDWTLVYELLDDGSETKKIKKSGLDLKFFPIKNLDHCKGTEQSVWRVDATPGLKGKWLAVGKVKGKNA